MAKGSPETKPRETAAEQHKRFVEVAKKLETDESPKAFDRAFEEITRKPK
jgi:hypothetical protein